MDQLKTDTLAPVAAVAVIEGEGRLESRVLR
jgi:hypothetical protein